MKPREMRICGMPLALATALCLILLGACASNQGSTTTPTETDPTEVTPAEETSTASDVVYGTSCMASSLSTDENGVYFISQTDSLLSYYDFESGSSDVICGDSACAHSDDSCIAYVGGYQPFFAGGYAHYGDYVYVMRQRDDGLALELLRIDPQGQTKESVASFGGEEDAPGWTASSIGDVYYSGGYAWVTVNYQKTDAANEGADTGYAVQLVSIDLSTGEVRKLTDAVSSSDGLLALEFVCISPELVLYEYDHYAEPPLSPSEYVAQGNALEDYAFYLNDYYGTATRQGKIVQIDVAGASADDSVSGAVNDSTRVLWEGELEETYVEDWGMSNVHPPYSYCGVSGGRLLRSRFYVEDGSECNDVSLLLEDGSAKELLQLKNGSPVMRADGAAASALNNDDTFLYLLNEDDGSSTYYSYSLADGKSRRLFSDGGASVLQVFGETSDRFVGRAEGELAWTYKADFEAGNFSAVHKLDVDFA